MLQIPRKPVPKVSSQKDQEKEKEKQNMIIQHTTYDASRGNSGSRESSRSSSHTRPTRTPNSNNHLSLSQPILLPKSYAPQDQAKTPIPKRRSSGKAKGKRPITAWPHCERGKGKKPATDFGQMTEFLTKQVREEKGVRKGGYVTLEGEKKGRGKENPLPRIERKAGGRFPDSSVDEKTTSGVKQEGRYGGSERRQSLSKLQRLQKDIRSGKIEKVIPPLQQLPWERGRLAPPRGGGLLAASPGLRSNTESSPISTSTSSSGVRGDGAGRRKEKKKSRNGGKVAEYLGHSADAMDDTLRMLTGKLRPPFEHLGSASFSSPLRAKRVRSCDSSRSFHCRGNDDVDEDGTTPAVLLSCRLCRRELIEGASGLCERCEKEFSLPQAPAFGGSSSSDEEDEIRPTPPLKDRKTLSMRKETPHIVLATGEAGNKPQFVAPDPIRQDSLEAEVLGGGDRDDWFSPDEEKLTRTNSHKMREALDKWSTIYGRGEIGFVETWREFDEGEEDDLAPLISPKSSNRRTLKNSQRSSSFYGFWDDLLHSPEKKF